MGTAAVVTLPAGALLDRLRPKPILISGNLVSALGYGGLAFVDRPWQGFVCSAVGGAGLAVAGAANQVLSLTLVTPEQRAASIALRRVAGNFGMGAGATVAGFIVASAVHLGTFQALYLLDAATFAVFALVVLMGIPNPRLANAASASGTGSGFGGTLLATSPDAVSWGGALTLALTAAGFLRLGHRIPDPLLQAKSEPLQAAPEPT
jgi:MFS family permease